MDGLVAILVICAILGAVLAGSKHRSRVGWFVVCLVTGLLGLAVLAVLPNGPRRY